MYGAGEQTVVDHNEVWSAIMAIPRDRTYAIPLALFAGSALYVAGLIAGFRNRQAHATAIVGIGAGLAAAFSALIVLKHYAVHYTAGVSATLPACVVSVWLFALAWNSRARLAAAALVWAAALLMAGPVLRDVVGVLAGRSSWTDLALADMKDIKARTEGMKRVVDFAYRAPFSQYGEGFVIHYAGVPRLTQAYLQNKGSVTSSITEQSFPEDVGAYVIDKAYFPTVEAVRNAANVDLLGPKPVRVEDGDQLIELRTVFLLIRK
jgi:hypothetical protein